MKIDLVKTLNNEKFIEVGENFKKLVGSREYKEARKYYNDLTEKQKNFIRKDEKYKICLKTLSISSL